MRAGAYLGGGTVVDVVHTYFGHRTISTGMVDGASFFCILFPIYAHFLHFILKFPLVYGGFV